MLLRNIGFLLFLCGCHGSILKYKELENSKEVQGTEIHNHCLNLQNEQIELLSIEVKAVNQYITQQLNDNENFLLHFNNTEPMVMMEVGKDIVEDYLKTHARDKSIIKIENEQKEEVFSYFVECVNDKVQNLRGHIEIMILQQFEEFPKLMAKLRGELDKDKSETAKIKENYIKEIDEQKIEINNLKTELKETSRNLQNDLDNFKKINMEDQTEIVKLNDEIRKLKAELNENEIEKLKIIIQNKDMEQTKLSILNAEYMIELNRLKTEYNQMKYKLNDVDQCEKQNAVNEIEIKNLNQKLEDASNALKTELVNSAKNKTEINKLTDELKKYSEKSDKEIKELKIELEDYYLKRLSEEQNKYNILQIQLENAFKTLTTIQSELDLYKFETKRLQMELVKSNAELKKCSEMYQKKTIDFDKLMNTLANTRNACGQEIENLNSQIRNLYHENYADLYMEQESDKRFDTELINKSNNWMPTFFKTFWNKFKK